MDILLHFHYLHINSEYLAFWFEFSKRLGDLEKFVHPITLIGHHLKIIGQ